MWRWIPVLVFVLGAIAATVHAVNKYESFLSVQATVIGVVHPTDSRKQMPRELFELRLEDGRTVQAYSGVVGNSSPIGARKTVYFEPEASFAERYEENERTEPNTDPVYPTRVSTILVPTVLWAAALTLFIVVKLLSSVKPQHASPSDISESLS